VSFRTSRQLGDHGVVQEPPRVRGDHALVTDVGPRVEGKQVFLHEKRVELDLVHRGSDSGVLSSGLPGGGPGNCSPDGADLPLTEDLFQRLPGLLVFSLYRPVHQVQVDDIDVQKPAACGRMLSACSRSPGRCSQTLVVMNTFSRGTPLSFRARPTSRLVFVERRRIDVPIADLQGPPHACSVFPPGGDLNTPRPTQGNFDTIVQFQS